MSSGYRGGKKWINLVLDRAGSETRHEAVMS